MTHLRLSYNVFVGSVDVNFSTLPCLEMIHLHGNRLTGSIVGAIRKMTLDLDENAFISDCGQPSDIDPSIKCTDCTMCCKELLHPFSCVLIFSAKLTRSSQILPIGSTDVN